LVFYSPSIVHSFDDNFTLQRGFSCLWSDPVDFLCPEAGFDAGRTLCPFFLGIGAGDVRFPLPFPTHFLGCPVLPLVSCVLLSAHPAPFPPPENRFLFLLFQFCFYPHRSAKFCPLIFSNAGKPCLVLVRLASTVPNCFSPSVISVSFDRTKQHVLKEFRCLRHTPSTFHLPSFSSFPYSLTSLFAILPLFKLRIDRVPVWFTHSHPA